MKEMWRGEHLRGQQSWIQRLFVKSLQGIWLWGWNGESKAWAPSPALVLDQREANPQPCSSHCFSKLWLDFTSESPPHPWGELRAFAVGMITKPCNCYYPYIYFCPSDLLVWMSLSKKCRHVTFYYSQLFYHLSFVFLHQETSRKYQCAYIF